MECSVASLLTPPQHACIFYAHGLTSEEQTKMEGTGTVMMFYLFAMKKYVRIFYECTLSVTTDLIIE